MLEVLQSRNVYRAAHCKFFSFEKSSNSGLDPKDIFHCPDASFDAVLMAGCFSKGHLPVSALREVERILKPGTIKNNTFFCHLGTKLSHGIRTTRANTFFNVFQVGTL